MKIWSSEIKELGKLRDSIKGEHPKLDNELERLIKTDDENIVLVYARRCLEVMITDLCERELKRPRGTEPLKGIIDKLNKEEKVPHNIIVSMQNLNSLSTFGAHPKDFDPMQVKPVILDLTTSLRWYLKYTEAQAHKETEPGGPEERAKEPAGDKKVTTSSKKRILLASGILLVCAVVVVALIFTDVIKGGKGLQDGEIKSLLILPFGNYTGADSLEYFVDGMHSSLITDMGKIGSLLIPGKTTSKAFKNSGKTIAQITSEVHVDAALETDVLCLGDSICLQVRLILPGKEEKQLWVADFKEDKSQILNLYNKITRQIADEVLIELTPEEERLLSKSRTVDREAYDAYLMGLYLLEDLNLESLNKAREYLNSAIEKNPDWAPLYSSLAQVWMSIVQMGFESPEIAGPKIFENLNKALELDPNNADSHFVSGMIAFLTEWDWEKAEMELLKALAANPNDAMSRVIYAQLLGCLQRPGESLTQGRLAIELDPLNPLIQVFYAVPLLNIGDYKTALAYGEKITAGDPGHFVANSLIEVAAFYCRDYNKVMEAAQYIFAAKEEEVDFKEVERIFGETGFVAAYEEILRQLEVLAQKGYFLAPVEMAYRYMMVDQPDKAMEWIEKGFEVRDPVMPYIATHGFLCEPLFDNPRFIEILQKMNLPLPKIN